ncbi:thioesterase [Streptacidiphilus sp. PB12-B1b]|uniref:thioesterase II family protein n=1 Tax=Streptacidiphilus sp. PB12-B1b TaxID=2705012 RepID=UPI0015F8EF42|nr:alpha/beta fold hydrolase [Streptacidiphilus sp. PB12-B1b]QMU77304.1 thioesterase [Streptacidiphilus sp. PB12-B1b]
MSDWTRCFHPAPASRVRLVCFPHAGGSASGYHALSAAVSGPDAEPWVVQYPGRQDRYGEPFARSMAEIVDAVLAELPATGDLALFGHSMGAVLAFEAARRLQAAGRSPVALIVSGRAAPATGTHPAGRVPVRSLDDAALVADMRALAGTSTEVLDHPDLLELLLPAVRADYQILDDHLHRPGPPLHCPVTALAGDRDPRVTPEQVQAWRHETTGPFACHVLPGGHFFLDDQLPHVADLIVTALHDAGQADSGR